MATILPECRPQWLIVLDPRGEYYEQLKHLVRSKELHILPLLFDILETLVPRQM